MRMSLRLISSSLCNVARATVAAADEDRLERRDRRQHAGAADLNQNVVQPRLDAFRFVLVGDRPTRRLRGEAERFALREAVHLHDRAVGLIDEIVAHAIEFADGGERLFDRVGDPPTLRRRQAELLQQRKQFRMLRELDAFDRARAITDEPEWTLRRHRRIELLQRAGGGVARIREDRQAGFLRARRSVSRSRPCP